MVGNNTIEKVKPEWVDYDGFLCTQLNRWDVNLAIVDDFKPGINPTDRFLHRKAYNSSNVRAVFDVGRLVKRVLFSKVTEGLNCGSDRGRKGIRSVKEK